MEKQKKTVIRMLIAVAVIVLLYIVRGIYSDHTGTIKTELALKYTQKETLVVEGFAVRDESHMNGSVNSSVLIKDDNLFYVPNVSDGESVAVNDVIAVAFASEEQANNYSRILELKEKVEQLKQLSFQDSIKGVNVTFLNSQIYSSVTDYVDIINSGNLAELSEFSSSFTRNVTTKQIATGSNFDVNSEINQYENEIATLEAGLGAKNEIRSPYAGYFVSSVDGFESTKLYTDVRDSKIEKLEGEKLLKAESEAVENAYGKIVGQHTWYMIFDISIKDASVVKTGSDVNVEFLNHSIKDVTMSVYNVTELQDDKISVVLKCTNLNEELVNLRKEKISITLTEYKGYRINSDALVENDEGIKGVYVLHGNIVRFTPINVLYYGENYVIAEKYTAYKKDDEGNLIVDEETTSKYRTLKTYDQIIVKGINLEDGKVID